MAGRAVCPRCGAVLSVREDAPAQITRLRCLGGVVNPIAPLGEVPRRAIPIDQDMGRDVGGTLYLFGALAVLMGIGMLIAFSSGNIGLGLLLMVGVAVVAIVGMMHWAKVQKQAGGTWQMNPREAWIERVSGVLDYRTAPQTGSSVLRGCGAVILVGLGIVLLLFGLCVATLVGDSFLSGPWPPR